MRQLLWIGLAVVAVAATSAVAQASITAAEYDGVLTDWGITIDGNKHLVYTADDSTAYASYNPIAPSNLGLVPTPTTGTNVLIDGRNVSFMVEDTSDDSNSYWVGPQYGGQNFDGEALLVSVEGNKLRIAIATGQRPDNGKSYYEPGDISIVSQGGTVWGIEVGGGAYNTGVSMINGGDAGTTYALNTNGYSTGTAVGHNAAQTAGSIWATGSGDWLNGIWQSGPIVRTQLVGGAEVSVNPGQVGYAYNFGDGAFGQHAFIELVVDDYTSIFGDLDGATIQWAPACGNDQLLLSVTVPTGTTGDVPEPASVVVWTLLIAAVGWTSWRRKTA